MLDQRAKGRTAAPAARPIPAPNAAFSPVGALPLLLLVDELDDVTLADAAPLEVVLVGPLLLALAAGAALLVFRVVRRSVPLAFMLLLAELALEL